MSAQTTPSQAGNKRILVIEDDPTSRRVLSDYLNAHGYRATVARDGEEGLDRFFENPPDLMLVDVQLPRKNGFEVCFEVRRTPQGRDLPVVFMSAVLTNTETAEANSERLRAQGYLIKPFQLSALLERVDELIGPA